MSLETCLSIGRIASILGLSKEEMQAKRDIEDKANQRLNQMSETDLKFFKGIGGGGGVLGGDDEEEGQEKGNSTTKSIRDKAPT